MKQLYFLIIFITTLATAQAQQPRVKTIHAKVLEKTRGINTHITEKKPTKDVAVPVTKPVCTVEFKNNTGYVIDIYLHGVYQGSIGAYGSQKINVGAANEKIYCISTGGTREWEFADTFDCGFDVLELA